MPTPLPSLPAVHKSRRMFNIEQANGGQDIRLILIELYNRLGSQSAVAKELGVSQPVIEDWGEQLGIVFETFRVAKLANAPTDTKLSGKTKTLTFAQPTP